MHQFFRGFVSISGVLALALVISLAESARAQDTAITYQGQLSDAGQPFTGTANLEFRLFDQLLDGSQVGTTQNRPNWPVEDGLFQVELDFGNTAFTGQVRYLEVTVDGSLLTPRQAIRPAPVALFALDGNEGPPGPEGASPFVLDSSTGTIEYQANSQVFRFEPDSDAAEGPRLTIGHAENQNLGIGGTIGGGGRETVPNVVNGDYGVVAGGYANTASAALSVIGGGWLNVASGENSTIAGGRGGQASGEWSAIGGGQANDATGMNSTVAGGRSNQAASENATVGGGDRNNAQAADSTVSGGEQNDALGFWSAVGGGGFNTASGQSSMISGGFSNTASGGQSFVAGGAFNCAGGLRSWAGGLNAKVRPGSSSGAVGEGCQDVPLSALAEGDAGTFVWADNSSFADFVSTGVDQFLIRADGGVGINTNAPTHTLSVNGTASKPGGGSWSVFSDARLKHEIRPLTETGSMLERLLSLRGYQFEYRESAIRSNLGLPGQQVGLIAQEVRQVFPEWVAATEDGHLYVTERGTTALFVEALRELRKEKDAQIDELQAEVGLLRDRIDRIQASVDGDADTQARLAALEALLLQEKTRTPTKKNQDTHDFPG